ncbi:AAA family ATPase [Arthrobacter sp. 35/47]|uniref:AAA family ATPase n=1 Tax=Arthrobacter sp. 35/47 TaxID=269454 RepID=UPI000479CD25|nr:AAA family ATPase [Arthrobacter sp. 35/47]
MWISRIRVTGGFLNGLDVSLNRGLNVIVGPRGAGKTTFLELLRHAVGAQHAEQSGPATRNRQAFLDAVLGAGEVIVDVESDDGGRHLVVDAKGGGQRFDLSKSVLVLGQNELEEIASDAPSRLNLLDLRTGAANDLPDRGGIEVLTGEIFDIRVELDERREESKKRKRLVSDRALFLSQETALLGGSTAQLSEKRDLLRQAEERVISTGQDLERIEAVRSELANLLVSHQRELGRLHVTIERAATLSRVPAVLAALTQAASLSEGVGVALSDAQTSLDTSESEIREHNIGAREAAAPIREELEQAETGLGQITAQLRNVDTALRALDENDVAVRDLEARHVTLLERRGHLLDSVEQVEEALYETRADVARATTAQVANNVVIVVDHLADATEFRRFLQDSLRGSSTRTTLIDSVAERVLPRQLLEMIETNDASGLAAVAGMAEDRAQRLIDNLTERDLLQGLGHIRLTDSVDFRLRDGSVDKSVDSLSTGQKCAVTLPIVLSERERTLILDQPEDHLDNAFLVTNIVSGLNTRGQGGAQTIVATHNANIPVLGSAENVVVLSSDGKVGRVDVQGAFDSADIVDKITELMEGGREAFARRSAFYTTHGGFK